MAGKTLNYTATVGALPVRDERAKIAEVVVTSMFSTAPAIRTGR